MASGTTTGAPPGAPPEPPQQAPPSPPEEKGPSRTDMLFRNRKRLLLALALLVLAVGVAVASTAVFTSSAANPSGTLAAGSLNITNENNKVIFNAPAMVPKDTADGDVTITNTGQSDGIFTVTMKAADLTDTPGPNGGNLSAVLELTITDLGTDKAPGGGDDAVVYGPALFKTPFNVNLPGYTGDKSAWKGAEAHKFRFHVLFADTGSAQNQYQGSTTKTAYTWDAVTK